MEKRVELSNIVDNPFQPRKEFDKEQIRSLAEEIKAEGFWNTTLQARKGKNGKVELVFGHRRLRALKLLKADSVKIEMVDLSDAQMAMRGLEENLQREGLADMEKADAVKRAVELVGKEREAQGKPARGAVTDVADRLGLVHQWVSTLCDISASMEAKDREVVSAGHLTAKTALAAKQWGGAEYVKTLAKQSKEAAKDDTVSKPTHTSVAAMRKAVNAAPEPVREKLKQEIVEGKITAPQKVKERARRLASNHVRREKAPPADLKEVIVGWTYKLEEWEKEMRLVQPYMDYVEEAPPIAQRFRSALKKLIETATALL
jgi:ParB/RepB/Spo0J family partition protein